MPSFIVNDTAQNRLSSKWKVSEKFDSKGRIVDYKGREYRLVSKQERLFSKLERAGRGFLATLLAVASLGIALLFKCVRNLYTKNKESIRFASPLERRELDETITVNEEMLAKNLPALQNGEDILGVCYHNSKEESHRVFSFDSHPDLIFRMKKRKTSLISDEMFARYDSMIRAKEVCQKNRLNLLVVPSAKLIPVGKTSIIAEKRLPIVLNDSLQEQNYAVHANNLNEAIRQLAIYICKTGYHEPKWGNCPVIEGSASFEKSIALMDFSLKRDAREGLFGYGNSAGLVGLVTAEQGKIVKKVAKKHGISTANFGRAHSMRTKYLAEEERLKKFYESKEIQRGDEELCVNVSLLGLDLDEQCKYQQITFRMKDVTKDVVDQINKELKEGSPKASIKGRRNILLSTNEEPFKTYYQIEASDWVDRILTALKDKGHIFNFQKTGCGFQIQA